MAITFACKCGIAISVLDQYAGTRYLCPECNKVLTVPTPQKPAAPVGDALGFADPEPPKVKRPKYVPRKVVVGPRCPQCRMPTAEEGEICDRCAGGRAREASERTAERDVARRRKWEPDRSGSQMFGAFARSGNQLLWVLLAGGGAILLVATVVAVFAWLKNG